MSKFRLIESKQDIQNFIDKFGQENYDNFIKAKDRLKNNGLSTDLTWYVKHMSKEELEQTILSLYNKDTDKQKVRQIKKETHNVRGKYKFFGEIDGFLVYQPLDYISSMDLGINTGWCTAGRYGHAGNPKFTPSAEHAKKHWDDYTKAGCSFYYFLNPETFYGEYALTVAKNAVEISEHDALSDMRFYCKEKKAFVKTSNVELFNANDDPIWYNEKVFDIAKKIGVKMQIEFFVPDGVDIESKTQIWKPGMLIPDFIENLIVADGVTTIGNQAFYCHRKLKSITIPNGVVSIGRQAFSDCEALTKIIIPDSVTKIGEAAFWDCTGLREITIPASVAEMGENAFYRCEGLTRAEIYCENIGQNAFGSCFGLKDINIHSGVTCIEKYAFSRCISLTEITIPNGVTRIGGGAFQDCAELTKITIPDGIVEIAFDTFTGCEALTEINIPKSVTEIGGNAFAFCRALSSITIPSSVKTIEAGAFQRCTGLTKINIPNSVTEIEAFAFWDCTALADIAIPNSVTEIGNMAFDRCSNLTIKTNSKYVQEYCNKNDVKWESLSKHEGLTSPHKFRLIESKNDIQAFTDKFGQDIYEKYKKQQKIIADKYGNKYADITWCVKHLSVAEAKYLIRQTKNSGDIYKEELNEICASPRADAVTKIFDKDGYVIYKIETPEASVKYGLLVGGSAKWCISGGYYHKAGSLLREAQTYYDRYLRQKYMGYYFCFTPDKEKYAICPYPGGSRDVWNRQDTQINNVPGLAEVAGKTIRDGSLIVYKVGDGNTNVLYGDLSDFVKEFNNTHGAEITNDDVTTEKDGKEIILTVKGHTDRFPEDTIQYTVDDEDKFKQDQIDNILYGADQEIMIDESGPTATGEEYLNPAEVGHLFYEVYHKWARSQTFEELCQYALYYFENDEDIRQIVEQPEAPSVRDHLIETLYECISYGWKHNGMDCQNQLAWMFCTISFDKMFEDEDPNSLFDWQQWAENKYESYIIDEASGVEVIWFVINMSYYAAWRYID